MPKPQTFYIVAFTLRMLISDTMASDAIPFFEAIDRAAVVVSSLGDMVNDALILGNGDVNGLLAADGEDLVFRLTKNDVWDARLDSKLDPPLPTLTRLKELLRGEWLDREQILAEGSTWKGPDSYHAHTEGV